MKPWAPILLILLVSAVATSAVQPARPAAMPGSKAALPTTDDSNQAVVYRDALAPGWEDWSWDSSIQLASSEHAHAPDGTVSIRAEFEPWGALSLRYPSGFRTSPYQWIEFYIYVGENTLRRLSFVFGGNADSDLLPRVPIDDPRYIAGETYIANRWQRVRIPLADTGGAETVIWGIAIQDASSDGQEPFWVDGIRFLASTPLATPGPEAALPTFDASRPAVVYRDMLGLFWQDWSWNSSIQLASTRHAHVPDGTVSIQAELRPWGSLSLGYPFGFSTSPYQWIEFYIYVGENTLRRLSFVFNGNSDSDLLPRVSIDDPRYIAGETYIANRWQRVRIPLADTGGAETAIWGININDASGDGQEPFWVDGIRFLASTPLATPGPRATLPKPDISNQAVVYRDVLGLGWEDWSWDSDIQLGSTRHVHASDGTVSIRAELQPWGALSLRYPSGLRTSSYQWIEFYIYVGENTLRRLSLSFGGPADDDLLPRVSIDDPRYIAGETYIANRWQRVRIPLADTGGAETAIWGITIKDESGDGQEPFWVDGIRFLASTPLATPAPTLPANEASAAVVYRNTLARTWEDWSWYSSVDLASPEHAHSKPVSIKASLGGTGALSLHVPGFSTAPYHWLEFYIYVGDNTLRQLSVYFNDTADNELMPKVSVDDHAYIAMGAYIPNRWQRVRIPLSATGGADTDILRINFKDESGAGQQAFWIDDIRFLPAEPETP